MVFDGVEVPDAIVPFMASPVVVEANTLSTDKGLAEAPGAGDDLTPPIPVAADSPALLAATGRGCRWRVSAFHDGLNAGGRLARRTVETLSVAQPPDFARR